MDIEKGETANGPFIKFEDNFGIPCEISIEWSRLRFMPYSNRNLPEYTAFTQEQIKQLLPYLQNFADTGAFEKG